VPDHIFSKLKEAEMATTRISASRLIIAAGFSVAALAAPAVAAFAMTGATAPTIAACPGGESEDIYTGNCTPDLVPNSPTPFEGSASIPGNPSLPAVDGIPCTGGNSGQCIGLSEEQQAQGPIAVPHSSVSSSP
jgi:hypothetical protein